MSLEEPIEKTFEEKIESSLDKIKLELEEAKEKTEAYIG